jgi:hypothetical protein
VDKEFGKIFGHPDCQHCLSCLQLKYEISSISNSHPRTKRVQWLMTDENIYDYEDHSQTESVVGAKSCAFYHTISSLFSEHMEIIIFFLHAQTSVAFNCDFFSCTYKQLNKFYIFYALVLNIHSSVNGFIFFKIAEIARQ